MQVINIIVSDCESGIKSIDSFGILYEVDKGETIDQAKELYMQKCKEIKFGEGFEHDEETDNFGEEVNDTLDDGYMTINGITVSYVWSYIDNVQL